MLHEHGATQYCRGSFHRQATRATRMTCIVTLAEQLNSSTRTYIAPASR